MGDMADMLMVGDPWSEDWYGEQPFRSPREAPRCKYCGEPGLYWLHTDDGWRLHEETGERHVCAPDHSALAKEFKQL